MDHGTAPTTVGPPQMVEMGVAPRSYILRQGTRFAELVSSGSFQIVKGQYFEDCWARKQRIQPRQQIPKEYLFDAATALQHWYKYGARFLVVISYAWIDAEHPDPDLWHVERLAAIISAFRKYLAEELERDNRNPGALGKRTQAEDIGLIMDYTSLWQREMKDGVDQRTPEQLRQFLESLSEINTPYGHQGISAWILRSVPKSVLRTYDDRGWTFFEKSIIDSKGLPPSLSKVTFRTVVHFDIGESDLANTDLKAMFSRPVFQLFSGQTAVRCEPPLTPERFLEQLEQRSSRAATKNVNLFTNGKEDRPLVERKYRESFEELTKTKCLDYGSSGWGAAEVREFGHALPSFSNLQDLCLAGNQLKYDGAVALAEELQKAPRSLRRVKISGCSIGPSGQLKMLSAWWRRYPCSCMNCLATIPSCFFSCCNCCCCCQGCIWCSLEDGDPKYLYMHAQSAMPSKNATRD